MYAQEEPNRGSEIDVIISKNVTLSQHHGQKGQ